MGLLVLSQRAPSRLRELLGATSNRLIPFLCNDMQFESNRIWKRWHQVIFFNNHICNMWALERHLELSVQNGTAISGRRLLFSLWIVVEKRGWSCPTVALSQAYSALGWEHIQISDTPCWDFLSLILAAQSAHWSHSWFLQSGRKGAAIIPTGWSVQSVPGGYKQIHELIL